MLSKRAEYVRIHRAEVEVNGSGEPDTAVLGLTLTEETREGEELEVALSVGVSFLMQPLRECMVKVGVDQTLQQVIVLDWES